MLIDDFLPDYDVSNRYATSVKAPREKVWPVVRRLDISSASVSMLLFRLRGISAARNEEGNCDLDKILKMGFVILGEKENEELLLGLIGKPWNPSGSLVDFTVEEFRDFDKPGYAKVAWSFSLKGADGEKTMLETETRVHCNDDQSRWNFGFYWFFVGPFSGLTRKEMLQVLKSQAETVKVEVSVDE